MIVNPLTLLYKGGKQVSGSKILIPALILVGMSFGCAPEASTSATSPKSTSSATGAVNVTPAEDMNWMRKKAEAAKGNFSLLSAEEQARVQAITKGRGAEVLRGMAPSK